MKLAQELDKLCHEHYNKTFKEGLLKHAKTGIQTKTNRNGEKNVLLYDSAVIL